MQSKKQKTNRTHTQTHKSYSKLPFWCNWLIYFLFGGVVSVLLQEKKRAEASLSELRRSYETEVCELQCKIQRMQMVHFSLLWLLSSGFSIIQHNCCSGGLKHIYMILTQRGFYTWNKFISKLTLTHFNYISTLLVH